MKRILIVNVNWLGDTLFVTPFIRAVRDSYPKSYIAILTHPRCREILQGNPYIDEIILYEEKNLFRKFSIIAHLKKKQFDCAFLLRRSLSRTMFLFLSKIPERIGYENRKTNFLLTKKVKAPSRNLHRVEHFLGLARGVGIIPKGVNYEFFISDLDRRRLTSLLEKQGLCEGQEFIAINPGGNWELKRWPIENFAKLGDQISKRLNLRVILTGAQKDVELCKMIASLMENTPLLLCGQTDLKMLGAAFQKAKWVISNDSGPMHIAVSVGAKVIALFGPTSPSITGPYGDGAYKILQKDVDCEIPCYKLSCEDNRCMKAITVEEVLNAISQNDK